MGERKGQEEGGGERCQIFKQRLSKLARRFFKKAGRESRGKKCAQKEGKLEVGQTGGLLHGEGGRRPREKRKKTGCDRAKGGGCGSGEEGIVSTSQLQRGKACIIKKGREPRGAGVRVGDNNDGCNRGAWQPEDAEE